MSNYLPKIEAEYSRGRGKSSMLSPLDWNLAADWEKKGIPLHIVLRAMGDGFKNFKAQKRRDNVNSLRYFTQEVEKQFAEWQTSQVGKPTKDEGVTEPMQKQSFAETTALSDENIEILETILEGFKKNDLPEPLNSAVAEIRKDLRLLIEEVQQKQLQMNHIEDQLKEMAMGLTLPMTISVPDSEREEMVAKIKRDYSQIKLDNDSRAKILTRQLYEKFGLPELTLFEI